MRTGTLIVDDTTPPYVYLLELGGEDDAFAAREAASAASDVHVVAPGIATAAECDLERARTLAYTHRISHVIGHTDGAVDAARSLLEAEEFSRTGSAAVRARTVRATTDVDTQAVERELGSVLVDAGFSIDLDDPDHVLVAVFSDDDCWLGWRAVESIRDFGARKPTTKPFFQPGSMDPLLARAVANIAGAHPNATILDPMCGTGGVLVEAGLTGASVVGIDAQEKMVRGAAENLAHYLPLENFHAVVRGDATHLPLADDSVDGVVFDAPYGRQSKIENFDLADLVAGALSEAHRVASRTVLVADRSWKNVARDAGWTIESAFERRVHRSLTRYILVLER